MNGRAIDGGAFDPHSSDAAQVTGLFWVMVGLGAAVFVLVLVLFVVASRGRREPDGSLVDRRSTRLVMGGGVLLPVVVLVPLTVAMLLVADRISPRADEEMLEIDVTGHQFWWELGYGQADTITANEIHVPAETPVRLVMQTTDVIHSVWAPQIAGKIDMIPGETTVLEIEVDEPGEYLGVCAEFCGIQHARMRFLVVAHQPDDFDAWLEGEISPAREPASASAKRGQALFAELGCGACHTVRGTDADGDLGPDLTHVASRRTLGAATLPNTREDLARWILDPQDVKPGNLMPPTPIDDDELSDLLDYLEALE